VDTLTNYFSFEKPPYARLIHEISTGMHHYIETMARLQMQIRPYGGDQRYDKVLKEVECRSQNSWILQGMACEKSYADL
jgi:hypothetical protein